MFLLKAASGPIFRIRLSFQNGSIYRSVTRSLASSNALMNLAPSSLLDPSMQLKSTPNPTLNIESNPCLISKPCFCKPNNIVHQTNKYKKISWSELRSIHDKKNHNKISFFLFNRPIFGLTGGRAPAQQGGPTVILIGRTGYCV